MIINEEYFALEDQTFRLVEAICSGELCHPVRKQSVFWHKVKKPMLRFGHSMKRKRCTSESRPMLICTWLSRNQTARLPGETNHGLDESVHRFRVAERELQVLLDKVSERLAHAVSSDILVSAGTHFSNQGF